MNITKFRLKVATLGCAALVLFLGLFMALVAVIAVLAIVRPESLRISDAWGFWLVAIIIYIIVQFVLFWVGIISVYLSSEQLGLKYRIIGIVCGWIPVANLVALIMIIYIVLNEIRFENNKIKLNDSRKDAQICNTKYPIVLVHGVFFRDYRYLNYWGRIPGQLEKNGARIYYGNHQSATSVADAAAEILDRIKQIVQESGCEKVNVIAHSKGGLDTRYALSFLDGSKYIASLTTINTPHRGCVFADYLLSKVPPAQKDIIANTYNSTLKKMGDYNPNFIEAVNDLTASACEKFNEVALDAEGVFYQSIGTKLNVASGGRFPLNMTNLFVRIFDGANDGLVGEESFPWGEEYRFITVSGTRGISHGDVIDLNRDNIDEFDVREFYVKLVQDLKTRGL